MSNTVRPFTAIRRRANLLDLLIPRNPATQGYRLLGSTTFSGSFVQFLQADISAGFIDRNVDKRKLHSVNNRDHLRVTFDPQTFNAVAGLVDADKFWLQFQPVDFAGTPGAITAPVLVLPESDLKGHARIQFNGNAPDGATVANSLQINLPYRMSDFKIVNNDGANSLFVAMEAGGGEYEVQPLGGVLEMSDGGQACLLLRGGGGAVSTTINCTNYLPL